MHGYHQSHTPGLWSSPSPVVETPAPSPSPTPPAVDVTTSKIARALYTHGPCSAQTVACVSGDSDANRRIAELVSNGHVSVRHVGDVTLFALQGGMVG